MMVKVHVYMCLHFASVKSTAGNKTKLFLCPFLIFTSWFFILAEAFRNDHVVTCNNVLRSVTENSEMGGYITVPFSSK